MNKIKDSLVADFLDFAVEANSRSTVDIRDGLKPVHRRILFSMSKMSGNSFIGSPKVVGNVLSETHPHGDASVYDAAIRLSQSFKTRYPLIDVHGNNGTISEPMGFAAARYTKMKLTPLGVETLTDIKKETVDFSENYDGSLMEPDFLPGLVPITLMNGTLGIGVGMASSIPPHNLREIASAVSHLIDNPEAEIKDLMRYIKGPDFPTGGTIINPEALLDAYTTGGGSAKIKADYEIKTIKGKTHIIVKEVPYLVDPEKRIIQPLKEMYAEGYEFIEDIEVQTGKGAEFQLDITLSKDAPVYLVIEKLIKETAIESSFTINLTTHVGGGKFQKKNLKELLQSYIDQNAVRNYKATEFDIRKAEARKLIVEGLIKATADIDEVVKIIRGSTDVAEANKKLRERLLILDIQAKAILDMRLARLTKLDENKLKNELASLNQDLKKFNEFLGDKDAQLEKIREDIQELARVYGDARKTAIRSAASIEEVQDITIFLTDENEIFAQPTDILPENRRNTKGKRGDNIISVIRTTSDRTIWVATEDGVMYPLEAASLAISDDVIKNIVSNFGINSKAVQLLVPVKKDNIITLTKEGTIKRSKMSEYSLKGSFSLCRVREGDTLEQVMLLDDDQRIFALLDNKKYLAFDVEEIRSTGANTIGTKINPNNVRVAVPENDYIVFIDENSDGKKVSSKDIKSSGRRTSGLACNDSTFMASCESTSSLYITGDDGRAIRVPIRSVNKTAATTSKGVALYNGIIGKILTD